MNIMNLFNTPPSQESHNQLLDQAQLSCLPALYAHQANSGGYPSPAAQLIYQRIIQEDLGSSKTLLQSQIQTYGFNDHDKCQPFFQKVQARYQSGMEAVAEFNPDVIIDLGCGLPLFLLDNLIHNPERTGLGLDFMSNIILGRRALSIFAPEVSNKINLHSIDLTNFLFMRVIFNAYVESLSRSADVKGKKLAFFNQGLFRYIPKNLHKQLAAIMYELGCSWVERTGGQVTWIQTDNEILDLGSDISKLNQTQANIFQTVDDMLETFTSGGWQADWNGKILTLNLAPADTNKFDIKQNQTSIITTPTL